MRVGGVPGAPRRTLLAGALAAPLLLAGCGIRLEDDAPPVPLVPTREPLPSEEVLTTLTRSCLDLATSASATPGSIATALVAVHRRQHTVLRTTLVRLGVPVEVVDGPSGSASPSPTPSTSRGARAARTALGAAEGAAASAVGRFTGVEDPLRDSVAALHAQRFAAALRLTGRAPEVAGDPIASDVVEELAARTEGARYLLQVVAARTDGRTRTRATATLEALDALLADQVAGGSSPEEALGHPLPFPVRTVDDATRLAEEALGTLRTAYGPRLPALLDGHAEDGWAAATRWLGAVEAECHRWGLPLQPFPGLT